jgi:hypothetical protein
MRLYHNSIKQITALSILKLAFWKLDEKKFQEIKEISTKLMGLNVTA